MSGCDPRNRRKVITAALQVKEELPEPAAPDPCEPSSSAVEPLRAPTLEIPIQDSPMEPPSRPPMLAEVKIDVDQTSPVSPATPEAEASPVSTPSEEEAAASVPVSAPAARPAPAAGPASAPRKFLRLLKPGEASTAADGVLAAFRSETASSSRGPEADGQPAESPVSKRANYRKAFGQNRSAGGKNKAKYKQHYRKRKQE